MCVTCWRVACVHTCMLAQTVDPDNPWIFAAQNTDPCSLYADNSWMGQTLLDLWIAQLQYIVAGHA